MAAETDGTAFRLIGAGLSDFAPVQTASGDFFAEGEQRALTHETAMDRLQEKFGKQAILTGRGLKRPAD